MQLSCLNRAASLCDQLVGDVALLPNATSDICRPSHVRFACIGDWGLNTELQSYVAQQLTDRCRPQEIDSVVTSGDNCYLNPKEVWQKIFEKPLTNVTCTRYPTLGILDDESFSTSNYGHLDGQQRNAEWLIKYSTVDPRWNMPSRYYRRSFGNFIDLFSWIQ
jgi:hypothetical protein